MPPVCIGIVYYSQVLEGINSVEGCEGLMHQVAETLPPERIKAPPKTNDPVIKAEQLPDCDGLISGFPTRSGGYV
ncbi:hypothetical protein D9Q98_006860 [Chlorella vulgaris]|uniref:Uncharacterized protein n=1 Tax=Chlorella vulgaris TaxID=3077 RepID=A0A9D4TJ47_CHLVU|nr:hypothetical protein D9Q98_006860 [Chlorella vulgaris]